MEDIFDKLQAIVGISKYSSSEIPTPKWVVTDMVDMFANEDKTIFRPDAKFLDPAVKSGRFLAEIYSRLMVSPLMVTAFPNEQDRHEHILRNQLFGVATSPTAATIVRKQLYNDPTIAGNIVYTADKVTKELIQGAFSIMKFDVVIGNPPYSEESGGGGRTARQGTTIYNRFIELGRWDLIPRASFQSKFSRTGHRKEPKATSASFHVQMRYSMVLWGRKIF